MARTSRVSPGSAVAVTIVVLTEQESDRNNLHTAHPPPADRKAVVLDLSGVGAHVGEVSRLTLTA